MKYAVIISAVITLILLGTGLYYYINDDLLYHRFFGFGTLGLFFVTFPLILIWRWNKFDLDKYTWKNPTRHNAPPKKKNTEE